MVGKTISHYQITEELGKGGMGVVYKATDTKLDRTVALKFLPTHSLPSDDDRVRFEREAKAAASLNHPNIATVYEIDETDEGQAFIAMELVEGETLADKVKRGPLKLEEAIQVASQIAEGLAAAHEKDIVHRDIKASNVMLNEKGQVKIMDFGLAKMAEASMLTVEGTTLGTVFYMSPEQARGEDVDHRADLWALGVVLYEMVSGQLPFPGDYNQAVLYSVLNVDPESLTGLRTGVPMELERIVAKLLMKDRTLRYQSAVEIPADLKAISLRSTMSSRMMTTMQTQMTAPVPTQVSPPKEGIPWRIAAPVVGVLLLLAGVLGWMLKPAPAPEAKPVARFSVKLPSSERFTRTGRQVIAISPDGTHIVHTANGQLHLRALDQLETSTVLGSVEDVREPFFSPDGQWVAFEHAPTDRLMKIAITGGAPVPLCELLDGLTGATWGADDTIVYGQEEKGIWRVFSAGGTPEVLVTPDSTGREYFQGPQVLPGGKAILFTRWSEESSSWNDVQIVVASLETGVQTVLLTGGTDARYLPTGHLVYAYENVLMARPFDIDQLAWAGSPVSLVENIVQSRATGAAHFSISSSGSLVYVPNRPNEAAPGWEMVWVDQQGALTPVFEEQRSYYNPSLSPDGRQIAVLATEGDNSDIWIYDVARGVPNRLTFGGSDIGPIWTPDGTRVTYSAFRDGVPDIYWRPADRSSEAELLWGGKRWQFANSWSPNGRFLSFEEQHPETDYDIWVLDMADTTATVFLNTAAKEENGMFSPDGQWLAYESDESGTAEVYVRPYPEPGGQVPISIGGGKQPVWARDGRTLYYLSEEKMMAVPVDSGPPFEAGEPEVLFEGQYFISNYAGLSRGRYDVHPDGERFLMLNVEGSLGSEAANPDQFKVVLNWFDELNERVPTE